MIFENMTTFETLVLFLLTVISVLIAFSAYWLAGVFDDGVAEIIAQKKAPSSEPIMGGGLLGSLIAVCALWGISVFIAGIIFLIIFLIALVV